MGTNEVPQLVLIVDDESMARALLRLILTRAGFEVMEAENGVDALANVARKQPDLVVLDVMMPGMDGFEVCLNLRQQVETSDLPIIMLSARADLDSITRGIEVGATKYLTKPISREELIQQVADVLNRR